MSDLHSIWLMPAADDETLLQALIDELAERCGTPRFRPHLTLVEDMARSVKELTPLISEIAVGIGDFAAPVRDIGGSSALYFRSLYALFASTGPLRELKRRAIARIASVPLDDFMPHISLLYGVSDNPAKQATQTEVAKDLLGRQIRFDRICVASSAKEISVAEWAIRSSVRLEGSRAF